MKVAAQVSRKKGRIEIIPLIDIMFFLLAAFMMVSIHKIKVKSLQVSLPTDVPVSHLEAKEDFVSISINALGQIQLDKEILTDPKVLLPRLQGIYATNKNEKFLVSADKDTRSGDMIAVLGKLRTAGFQHVAFSLKGGGASVLPPGALPSAVPEGAPAPGTPPAPASPGAAAPIPPTAPEPAAPGTPPVPTAGTSTSVTAPLAPPPTPAAATAVPPAAEVPPAAAAPTPAAAAPAGAALAPSSPPEASPPAAPSKP
jgi:biopolymer transport protein ExbD